MIRKGPTIARIETRRSPRITRRDGLAALVAGITGAANLRLCAATRELAEQKFIVISDTHLGYRDQEVAANQWSKMATELAAATKAF